MNETEQKKIYKVELGDTFAQVDLDNKADWQFVKGLIETAFKWKEKEAKP